jgi:hypothetical protein
MPGKNINIIPISAEHIASKIYIVRGRKVMLDSDLACLYQVETKVFNQAVKRNKARFPMDFMWRLKSTEAKSLRSQFVTSKVIRGGRRYVPYVFTEQGIAMLSSVLNSPRAIQVNIQIMRTFIKLKEWLASNEDIKRKIEDMEKRYDHNFRVVFQAIKGLFKEKANPKTPIGFRLD